MCPPFSSSLSNFSQPFATNTAARKGRCIHFAFDFVRDLKGEVQVFLAHLSSLKLFLLHLI